MLTRRDFLRYLGLGTAGAAAAALTGCGSDNTAATETTNTATASTAETVTEGVDVEVTTDSISVGEADESRPATVNGMSADDRYPVLRVAISNTPTNLNPWSSYDQKLFVCECLADWVQSDYQPRMIESYETDASNEFTIVTLKDYIYDADGNHITASDVVFTYQLYIQEQHTMKFQAYKDIEAIDDTHVKFYWNVDSFDVVGSLEKVWCDPVIVSQKAWEERNFAADPVYSGPYKIADYIDGNSIILEARDDYWETDETKIYPEGYRNVQRFELMVIAEAAQQVMALQNGTIDYSASVATENLDYFREGGEYAENYTVAVNAANNVYMMIPNFYPGKITADKNFRLACFYALDNATIATAVGACKALSCWANPVYPDYQESWATMDSYMSTYDLDKAKEYLDQTAYAGETLVLMAQSSEVWKLTLQTIQMLLLQIGVNTDLQLLDDSIFRSTTNDPDAWDFQFNWMGGSFWAGAINTQLEINKYPSIDPEMCNGFQKDAELQSLFDACRMNDNHTAENCDALYQYIVDNAYEYGIYTLLNNFVYTKDIASLYLQNGFKVLLNCSTYYLD